MAKGKSRRRANRKRVFYAYPAEPASVGETIRNFTTNVLSHPEIQKRRCRILHWSDIPNVGHNLLQSILDQIDNCDVFACDLTYPNANVAFELGYAIARFKRIWISINTTVKSSTKHFQQIYYQLVPAVYAAYSNSNDLANTFVSAPPIDTLDTTILGEYYQTKKPRPETPTLLYCKPYFATEAVRECLIELGQGPFKSGLLMDDPAENPSPTLEWYARRLVHADALLVHLLSHEEQNSWEHNIKSSIVAGLAKGFDRRLLMIAKKPFDPPVDYSSILLTHDTGQEAASAVNTWTTLLHQSLPPRRRRRASSHSTGRLELDIRHMNIGDPVAENERSTIDTYFLETSSFIRAMDEQFTIVVGRRGTGKSAQLYAMDASLQDDPRNAVFVIKPIGYEMAGLFRLVRSLVDTAERGYLIASLWKYLIYSELLKNVYVSIIAKPDYYQRTAAEERLVAYFSANRNLLNPPFSERLDKAVRALTATITIDDPLEQRHRISEHLHVTRIGQLRRLVANALQPYQKAHILFDNLDEPWKHDDDGDVAIFADVLAGLFQVSTDIISDFGTVRPSQPDLKICITIFLRSDILAVVQSMIRQFDKLPIQRISWHESASLRNLVDLRFQAGAGHRHGSQHVWSRLFPREVHGAPIWDYINIAVLPRPRDLLYLIRQAIDEAINRGHDSITEQDLVRARSRYSEYAFLSIIAEDDPRRGLLENVLYEFAGSPQTVSRQELQAIFNAAGVTDSDFEFYINLLCDINFLAIEENREFRLVRDEADRRLKRRISRTAARRTGRAERFRIAAPFVPVLGVE